MSFKDLSFLKFFNQTWIVGYRKLVIGFNFSDISLGVLPSKQGPFGAGYSNFPGSSFKG